MSYEYALRSASTGLFYTGEAGDHWIAKPTLYHPPFKFTEAGAWNKLESFRRMALCVNDFEVVRLS